MLELYHAGLTRRSKKVRHCLHEKGLDYQSRFVDLKRFEHHDPADLALNANGIRLKCDQIKAMDEAEFNDVIRNTPLVDHRLKLRALRGDGFSAAEQDEALGGTLRRFRVSA